MSLKIGIAGTEQIILRLITYHYHLNPPCKVSILHFLEELLIIKCKLPMQLFL